MGLCQNSEDHSKKTRDSHKKSSSDNNNNVMKKNGEPQTNTNIVGEPIINRLSKRTKYANINNDYIISEKILGKGATGIVREGQDKNGTKYAIKTVWKSDIEQNECFKKEIDITL